MQRALDLLGIAGGVAKVYQACAQTTCYRLEHCLKTSSLTQSSKERLNQACSYCFDAVTPNRSSKFKSHTNSNANNGSSNASFATSTSTKNETAGSTTTKRDFSHCSSSYVSKSFYHTSSVQWSLTADELAKLAQLKQTRIAQRKPQSAPRVQTLNPKSREKKVPSSRIGRIGSFGSLAAGLAFGSLSDYAKKTIGYEQDGNSKTGKGNSTTLLSESNLNRIVSTLCTVRGAALKLGQMLSIQDSSIVDPKLLEVFDRVRQSADFMPVSQMKKVLVQEFGEDWRSMLKEFDEKPFAAASIGQVHRAVLHDGRVVAMKIQYPGVAESINSDISNLVTLLKFWNVFPEQLFMDKFINVARVELALECDYEREGKYLSVFRERLKDEEIYGVPELIPELSSRRVLTTELVDGLPIDQVAKIGQDDRNFVAAAVLRLVMREIFEFRCMQTDPNWANFLYDETQQKLWLLDFGAARTYSKTFVDQYIEIVKGASVGDRQSVLEISKSLGFLTGYEPKVMEEAHVDAIMILGEPFSTDGIFDFSKQSTSNRIVKLIPTFLKHRLSPPPEESYSLHRKLSGAFLIATKLHSQFACKQLFDDVYNKYWSDVDGSINIAE